jgi:hypothetical protein
MNRLLGTSTPYLLITILLLMIMTILMFMLMIMFVNRPRVIAVRLLRIGTLPFLCVNRRFDRIMSSLGRFLVMARNDVKKKLGRLGTIGIPRITGCRRRSHEALQRV